MAIVLVPLLQINSFVQRVSVERQLYQSKSSDLVPKKTKLAFFHTCLQHYAPSFLSIAMQIFFCPNFKNAFFFTTKRLKKISTATQSLEPSPQHVGFFDFLS